MVRKEDFSASGTVLLHHRLIPFKEHTAQPHQPAPPPQRGTNLALFLAIQFPTPGSSPGDPIPSIAVFLQHSCALFPPAASGGSSTGTGNPGTPQALSPWLRSAMTGVGKCCAAPLLPQASTLSKFLKLFSALHFESGTNCDENSSRCKTASLFSFFKRHTKQISHQGFGG